MVVTAMMRLNIKLQSFSFECTISKALIFNQFIWNRAFIAVLSSIFVHFSCSNHISVYLHFLLTICDAFDLCTGDCTMRAEDLIFNYVSGAKESYFPSWNCHLDSFLQINRFSNWILISNNKYVNKMSEPSTIVCIIQRRSKM